MAREKGAIGVSSSAHKYTFWSDHNGRHFSRLPDQGFGLASVSSRLHTCWSRHWWTKSSSGEPTEGIEYELGFGPEYDWRAVVSRCVPDKEFELELTSAHDDWRGTRVGFLLEEKDGVTQVRFHHSGWPEANDHYRGSCYCWAMYLRLLRRYVENGETVPYEDRDSA